MDVDEDDPMDKMRKVYLTKLSKLRVNNGIEGDVNVNLRALKQQIPSDLCKSCAARRFQFLFSKKRVTIQCDACKSKLDSIRLKRKTGNDSKQKKITLDKNSPFVPSEKPAQPSPFLSMDKRTNKSKNRGNKLRKLAGFDDGKGPLTPDSSLLSFINSLK
ncbi:unnamed protein product [Bursaphelenchus xylophilus]|uniref:(pine wood nematode) hypothetical protein n=1 Tax=Bursaphelenchus xylophilus TaxID=6326 RepID=A0A1I7SMU1_BURXY|nr:unnamed protein product [Bursaphelenchus xylophilus]CAG9130379.1 unnamed protein product [Bursaphelenchus xylophilus]